VDQKKDVESNPLTVLVPVTYILYIYNGQKVIEFSSVQ
jgi:hypothetical protein